MEHSPKVAPGTRVVPKPKPKIKVVPIKPLDPKDRKRAA